LSQDLFAGSNPARASSPRVGDRVTFKVYKNPHTGEVVETKGGNHNQLKEWKAEHDSDTVESWLSK
jgi:hypothetical protein